MVDFESLVPEHILLAPAHPLAQQLELPLPDGGIASSQEIQPRVNQAAASESRTPGVVKRIVPLDADTFLEYWWCVPGRLLLPEDVKLLISDRDRIERIVAKLVWLFGAYCFSKDSDRHGDLLPVHDWQDVIAFARKSGFESYLLDIDFLPIAVKRDKRQHNPAEENTDSDYVAVEPPHWHIEFFQLAKTGGGFEIQQPKTVCSCQIWTGTPFIKHLHTGETSTRYDLWVSRPLDLTEPPWFK